MNPLSKFIQLHKQLVEHGVLGVNKRNAEYILGQNKRKFYPLVDNKLITKQLCMKHDIPTPELYGSFQNFGSIKNFQNYITCKDFVVKPARGAGGRGIMVVTGQNKNGYNTLNGFVSFEELKHHITSILSGLYSFSGKDDIALVERRVRKSHYFNRISYQGAPDIRIIIYRNQPVMAMLRLPTKKSHGRANLHQGAVAAGIDMETGITSGGVCEDRKISHHPDTGNPISGVKIPQWQNCLEYAAKLASVIELEYIGVDIVYDDKLGPLILEANARPGLAIQIANQKGLVKDLEKITADS